MDKENSFNGLYSQRPNDERRSAVLKMNEKSANVWLDGQIVDSQPIESVRVLSKVENVPCRVLFKSGGAFESWEDCQIPEAHGLGRLGDLITKMEKSAGIVTTCLAALILLLVLFFKLVLPLISPQISLWIPSRAVAFIEAQNIKLYEQMKMLPPSLATTPERQTVEAEFFKLKKEFPNLDLRLRIIGGPQANAFALPAGQIIVTDRFLKKVTNSDEVRAVLYHEIGHVVNRHGVQALIENSAVALIFSTLLGDVSGVGMMASLAATHYSRSMETEADLFATNKLLEHRQDPQALGRALLALEEGQKEHAPELLNMFSTHPPTSERIKLFKTMSETKIRMESER